MSNSKVCPHCGFIGREKSVMTGSVLIELLLWITFLLPGLIYSMLRKRIYMCPHCRLSGMIPSDSAMGQMLIEKFSK